MGSSNRAQWVPVKHVSQPGNSLPSFLASCRRWGASAAALLRFIFIPLIRTIQPTGLSRAARPTDTCAAAIPLSTGLLCLAMPRCMKTLRLTRPLGGCRHQSQQPILLLLRSTLTMLLLDANFKDVKAHRLSSASNTGSGGHSVPAIANGRIS